MSQLDGRVALVTGAGSGIGRASAVAFAAAGAAVLVCDIDTEGGKDTVERIRAAGGEARFRPVDVTDRADVAGMVDEAVSTWGRLDCAHNNAGITGPTVPFVDYDPSDWDRVVAIDLTAVFACMQAELRVMLGQGSGAIVNTASYSGLVAVPRIPAYVAAKHGVVGLSKAAAVEYARKGIRVNAVCPGTTRTPMSEQFTGGDPKLEEAVASATPIRRLAEPEEIARTVVWLCTDDASYVNGHALAVDGGAVAQ